MTHDNPDLINRQMADAWLHDDGERQWPACPHCKETDVDEVDEKGLRYKCNVCDMRSGLIHDNLGVKELPGALTGTPLFWVMRGDRKAVAFAKRHNAWHHIYSIRRREAAEGV